MNSSSALNRNLQTLVWGLLFILWGSTTLFDFLPAWIGFVGTGLIFLGLNAARALVGIPTREGTTILGILALVWGGLELVQLTFDLPVQLDGWAIAAIVLIVLGGILLTRALCRIRRSEIKGSQQSA